jgi:hypothetical protein
MALIQEASESIDEPPAGEVAGPGPGRPRRDPVKIGLRVLAVAAAAALAIDAYVHLHDAGYYDYVRTSALSQGTLFRVQGALAAAAGLMLLVRPRRIWWAAALLVAAGAFGAVELYRYVDVGRLGPLPDMYEPTWAASGKLASAWAEGAATVLAATGLAISAWAHRAARR